jgi:hypothetical protein
MDRPPSPAIPSHNLLCVCDCMHEADGRKIITSFGNCVWHRCACQPVAVPAACAGCSLTWGGKEGCCDLHRTRARLSARQAYSHPLTYTQGNGSIGRCRMFSHPSPVSTSVCTLKCSHQIMPEYSMRVVARTLRAIFLCLCAHFSLDDNILFLSLVSM